LLFALLHLSIKAAHQRQRKIGIVRHSAAKSANATPER